MYCAECAPQLHHELLCFLQAHGRPFLKALLFVLSPKPRGHAFTLSRRFHTFRSAPAEKTPTTELLISSTRVLFSCLMVSKHCTNSVINCRPNAFLASGLWSCSTLTPSKSPSRTSTDTARSCRERPTFRSPSQTTPCARPEQPSHRGAPCKGVLYARCVPADRQELFNWRHNDSFEDPFRSSAERITAIFVNQRVAGSLFKEVLIAWQANLTFKNPQRTRLAAKADVIDLAQSHFALSMQRSKWVCFQVVAVYALVRCID